MLHFLRAKPISLYGRPRFSSLVVTDEVVSIQNLSPSNYYEAQILSALPKWSGQRIDQYLYHQLTLESELPGLKAVQRSWYDYKTDFFKNKYKDLSTYNNTTSFQTDFYFRTFENVESCQSLFSGCISKLHPKTEFVEKSLTGKWVFVELTEHPSVLPQKLFQLERAARFLPKLDQSFEPEALCVLMNGPEDLAIKALEIVKIPTNAVILTKPLYIGWVPTRNIFSSLRSIGDQFNLLSSEVSNLKYEMSNLNHRFDRLEDLIREIKK